jgi:hypothetical protein
VITLFALLAVAPPRAGAQGGPREGIRVHGDWTIVVRNEDGSIAARHQFRNALVNPELLARLLVRGGSTGRWQVQVGAAGGSPQPCLIPSPPLTVPCTLEEPSNTTTRPGNLTVSVDGETVLIQGSVRALAAAQIALVTTALVLCSPSELPSINCGGGAHLFTQKDVSTLNISVGANQTMDITVRISFSS